MPLAIGYRTDLGVRTFQGLGKNAPLREQVVRRLTQGCSYSTRFLNRYHVKFIFRCPCTDVAFQDAVHRPVLLETFRLGLSILLQPPLLVPCASSKELSPAPFPSGGGGGFPCSFLRPFRPRLFRCCCGGPHFRNFLWMVASENSTFGTQTLLAMRKFLDEAELRSHQEVSCSQKTKEATNEGNAERKGEDPVECKREDPVEDGHSQNEAEKEVIRAFRTLLYGCEEQWCYAAQQDSVSSESEAEDAQGQQTPQAMKTQLSPEEDLEDGTPNQEPQLYLCDDCPSLTKLWSGPQVISRETERLSRMLRHSLKRLWSGPQMISRETETLSRVLCPSLTKLWSGPQVISRETETLSPMLCHSVGELWCGPQMVSRETERLS